MEQQLSRFDRSADRFLAAVRRFRRLSVGSRYGITIAIVLVALAARQALEPILHDATFTLFFPAVMLAALLFDSGTGIFATILSALLGLLVLPAAGYAPSAADPTFVANGAAFIVVGLFTSVALEALHRATARLFGALSAARRLESDNRVLLDELNHRVKNSMQVLASLITLRGHRLRDSNAAADFHALSSQVQVLGRLYSRLRFNDSTAEMEVGSFLADLIEDLRVTLVGDRPIAVDAQFDKAFLPVRRMVPLGLVLNEIVTNAFKHAFPAGRGGTIRVRLANRGEALLLEVSDDGIGSAPEAEPRLGSRLVDVLAQQLRARVERRRDGTGMTVAVEVPVKDDGDAWVAGEAPLD